MSKTEREVDSGWLNISAVERETGLSKDSLRVWERRYGFPIPARDEAGERIYPPDQVAKLRLLRQLIDRGRRPRAIAAMSQEELRGLLEESAGPDLARGDPDVDLLLRLLQGPQVAELQQHLRRRLHRNGLDDFARRFAPRMTEAVGFAWALSRLSVHQEHLFTQQLAAVLREAIDQVAPPDSGRPRVLLTTLPHEPHGLGLLMAEAVLVLAGAQAISLGVETPSPAIVGAVIDYRMDVAALSFSAWSKAKVARAGLEDLRRRLPATVEIWVGGSCSGLGAVEGVRMASSLDALDGLVEQWRQQHA